MGLTKATFAMIEGTVVNVFDYMTAAQIADVQAKTLLVDVTAAVQAAIDTGDTVYFPAGKYLITETLNATNTSLIGDSTVGGTVLKYTATDGTPCIDVNGYYNNGYYTTIRNIEFLGEYTNGSATDCTGLFLQNDADDDIDAYVDNCFFSGFKKSIHMKGRGLAVTDSIFVITESAFYMDRNDPVIVGSYDDQKVNSGDRAFMFWNNRFHAMGGGTIIDNTNPANTNKQWLRGISFVGNYIDTSARIMNGPCRESVFTNNIHIYPTQTQTIFFDDTGEDWYNVVISNNVITSWQNLAGGAAPRYNERIFDITGNIDGFVFNGNTIYNVNKDIIKVDGNLSRATITSNTLTNVLIDLDTANYRIVNVAGNGYRVQFNNNTVEISVSAVYPDYLVYFGGTGTNIDTSCNAFNNSAFLSCNVGGYINPLRKITYGGAAPTTGPWQRGDRVFNSDAAVGQPKSWVCTVSGTPGTWVSEGNL